LESQGINFQKSHIPNKYSKLQSDIIDNNISIITVFVCTDSSGINQN